MIAIIGHRGSMGTRYQAILNWLSEPFMGFDIEDSWTDIVQVCQKANGVIVCTPTDTHFSVCKTLIQAGIKKILCEKPISKNINEVEELYRLAHEHACRLQMVMQYTLLISEKRSDLAIGDSFYDYFRHGSDGLYWDCLQIIGLARGNVSLYEKSPVWRCMINGKLLKLGQMDLAYIQFTSRWVDNRLMQNPQDVIDMHKKVANMIEEKNGNKVHNRDSGKV